MTPEPAAMMSVQLGRQHERLRWHCRRGMLELDLVLRAFVERHLETLGPDEIRAFQSLLARPDPELLDLVMGREEAAGPCERALVARMRSEPCSNSALPPHFPSLPFLTA